MPQKEPRMLFAYEQFATPVPQKQIDAYIADVEKTVIPEIKRIQKAKDEGKLIPNSILY